MDKIVQIHERQLIGLLAEVEEFMDGITHQIAAYIREFDDDAHTVHIAMHDGRYRCSDCGCMHFVTENTYYGLLQVTKHECRECKTHFIVVPMRHSTEGNLIRNLYHLQKGLQRLNGTTLLNSGVYEVVEEIDFPAKFYTSPPNCRLVVNLINSGKTQSKILWPMDDSTDTGRES